MCYYVSQKTNHSLTFNDTTRESDLLNRPVVSGFEKDPLAVIKPVGKAFDIVPMEWGNWEEGYVTLNATNQHLFINEKGNKSLWADAARNNRCLVPVDGYYEFRHIYRLNGKTGKRLAEPDKYPYFVHSKSGAPLLLAACYRHIGNHYNVAICTTDANSLAAKVHNSALRMPTVLPEHLAKAWVYDNLNDDNILAIAKYQSPEVEMETWTVSTDFLKSANPQLQTQLKGCPGLEVIQNFNSADGQTLSLF